MAFLVEKDPHAVVKPHFHQADQYQVVVQGGGRLGTHDVGTVAVHYTDAWSAYGPIVAADEGIAWFTLRNAWIPVRAICRPRASSCARRGRRTSSIARRRRRRCRWRPLPTWRAPTGLSCATVIAQTPDGMATWRYRLPAGASVSGPDPREGGGQFWIVLSGAASAGGRRCCRRTRASSWRPTMAA